jgi:hypothetical protein
VSRRFDEIVKGLTPFLKQCGYNPKKDLTFIPISALHGHNVQKRATKEVSSRADSSIGSAQVGGGRVEEVQQHAWTSGEEMRCGCYPHCGYLSILGDLQARCQSGCMTAFKRCC